MFKAKIVSVLNPKGGSGKSTLTTNLAHAFELLYGKEVLIIDTDLQGTCSSWSDAQRPELDMPPVSVINGEQQLGRYVSKMERRFDLIVIDGSAKLEDMIVGAIKVSDVVVIPVQPSNADVWGVADLVDLIQTRRRVTEGIPQAVFVVSRQIGRTALAEGIGEALADYGPPILEGRTTQRVAFAEALSIGSTVLEYEPEGKAADEVRAITKELEALIYG